MKSIWSKTVDIAKRSTLPGDLKTEVAVIGAGLAGILTAYLLQRRNVKTIVLEANEIGSGQTKNTTAKITSQHYIIYSKLVKDFGFEKAQQYATANQQAIDDYRRIIREENISCRFEECPAYLYANDRQNTKVLEEEARAAQKLGINAEFTLETGLPFPVEGAVRFNNQAQFHPLAFLEAVLEKLDVYEHTRVNNVEENKIFTDYGTVVAKQIVFASHFPFINMPGFYFARMHQERSYVIALENGAKLEGMYIGIDKDRLSFRNFDELLLFGGGGHRTGENSVGGKYDFLSSRAKELYPESREVGRWSAQDCMTLDGVPYIGQFSSSNPNWYVATGFGKWGMTSSMVAANLIADAIVGKENPCREVFSPSRFTPSASLKTFVTDMGQSVKGLSKQIFKIPEKTLASLPTGHGGIVEHDGQKVGVYRDEDGSIYAVSVRCPHLGCQLEWNPDEKSWDCPCHGSRFDYRGKLLNNPAQTDLEVR